MPVFNLEKTDFRCRNAFQFVLLFILNLENIF